MNYFIISNAIYASVAIIKQAINLAIKQGCSQYLCIYYLIKLSNIKQSCVLNKLNDRMLANVTIKSLRIDSVHSQASEHKQCINLFHLHIFKTLVC